MSLETNREMLEECDRQTGEDHSDYPSDVKQSQKIQQQAQPPKQNVVSNRIVSNWRLVQPGARGKSLAELLAHRIYTLALSYEDLNDHEELRRDPLLALLAGKSTLNRLELTPAGSPCTEHYHNITGGCLFGNLQEAAR